MIDISLLLVLAVSFVIMVRFMGLKITHGLLVILFGYYLGKSPTWGPMIGDVVNAVLGK